MRVELSNIAMTRVWTLLKCSCNSCDECATLAIRLWWWWMVVVNATLVLEYIAILPWNDLVNWSDHCDSKFGNRALCTDFDWSKWAVSGSWELQHDVASCIIFSSSNHITPILPIPCPLLLHATLPSPLSSSWMWPFQGPILSHISWKVGVEV